MQEQKHLCGSFCTLHLAPREPRGILPTSVALRIYTNLHIFYKISKSVWTPLAAVWQESGKCLTMKDNLQNSPPEWTLQPTIGEKIKNKEKYEFGHCGGKFGCSESGKINSPITVQPPRRC